MDPMILIVLVVGFGALLLLNRRTKKKQQEQVAFRDRLEPGQQVQTIGGLIGTVTSVEDDRVTLETVPGTELVFLKAALAKLIEPEADAQEDTSEDTEAESEELQDGAGEASSPVDHGDDTDQNTQN